MKKKKDKRHVSISRGVTEEIRERKYKEGVKLGFQDQREGRREGNGEVKEEGRGKKH